MGQNDNSRRNFLKNAALNTGSAFVLNACTSCQPTANNQNSAGNGRGEIEDKEKKESEEKEVTASEDLMREHGILRRALIVYSEAAVRLRKNAADVPPTLCRKPPSCFARSAKIITKSRSK